MPDHSLKYKVEHWGPRAGNEQRKNNKQAL
jgi:hypothetical protein